MEKKSGVRDQRLMVWVRVWLGSPLLAAPPVPVTENPSPHKLTVGPRPCYQQGPAPEALAWLPSFPAGSKLLVCVCWAGWGCGVIPV